MRKEPKVTMYDSGVKITGKIESNLFEVEYTFENIHSKDFLNEKTGKISSFAILSGNKKYEVTIITQVAEVENDNIYADCEL